jgi:hypothetical protein
MNMSPIRGWKGEIRVTALGPLPGEGVECRDGQCESFQEDKGKQLRPVDYENLTTRSLGGR